MKKNYNKKWNLFLIVAMYFFNLSMQAQSVGIGTKLPESSALLELHATSKGLLIPRVFLKSSSDSNTVPSPAKSLLIFNINNLLVGNNGSGEGYYYNKSTPGKPEWVKLYTVEGQKNAAKVIWGIIDDDGTILSGSGDFKVNKPGQGQYEIIFDIPYTQYPVCIINSQMSPMITDYITYGPVGNTPCTTQVTKKYVWVKNYINTELNLVDRAFSFMCAGN